MDDERMMNKTNKLIIKWPVLLLLFIAFSILSHRLYSQHLPEKFGNTGTFDAVSFLQVYISHPSVSGNETEAALLVSRTCKEQGLYIKELNGIPDGINFIASLYPLESGKPNIIFQNHIDVVSPGNIQEWESDPFSGDIRNGRVYGRGAIDNKGLAAIQLSALLSFRNEASETDFPYNVSILSVSGEETGGQRGSKVVTENYASDLNAAVILGEGSCGLENISFLKTDKPVFGISIAEKSILWLKIHTQTNLTGHSSIQYEDYPNKRLVRALHKVLKRRQAIQFTEATKLMFRELGKAEGGLRGFALKHFNWIVFRPIIKHYIKLQPELNSLLCNTINLSNLQNPEGDPNQMALQASATLDCRLLPGNSSEKIIQWINRKVKDKEVKVEIICEGPSSIITYPDKYFYTMSESIREIYPGAIVIPVLFPASADNNYYRQAGFPTFGINPHILSMEQMASIHNANENIDVKEIKKGIEVFRNFIQKMMDTGIND